MPPDFLPNVGQLENVRLVGIEFRANEEFEFARYAATFGVTIADVEVELLGDASILRVALSVTWEPVEAREFAAPFDLMLTATGDFRWGSAMDDSYRRGWTEFNGLYLIWPYLRVYASTITVAAGLPPLVLPTLAVPHPGANGEEAGEFDPLAPGGAEPPASA